MSAHTTGLVSHAAASPMKKTIGRQTAGTIVHYRHQPVSRQSASSHSVANNTPLLCRNEGRDGNPFASMLSCFFQPFKINFLNKSSSWPK